MTCEASVLSIAPTLDNAPNAAADAGVDAVNPKTTIGAHKVNLIPRLMSVITDLLLSGEWRLPTAATIIPSNVSQMSLKPSTAQHVNSMLERRMSDTT